MTNGYKITGFVGPALVLASVFAPYAAAEAPVSEGVITDLVTEGQDPVRDAILDEIEDARQRRTTGETGYSEDMRRLAAAGYPSDAIQLLEEVITHRESLFDHREALRQKGQYFRRLGNFDAALQAFESHGALYRGETFETEGPTGFMSGQLSRAELLYALGRYDESLEVTDRMVAVDAAKSVMDILFAHLRLRRSLILEKLGRYADAAAEIDTVWDRIPDYGSDDHRGLDLRLRKLRLLDPDRKNDEYWNGLIQVWDDPELWNSPRVLIVAEEIIRTASRRGAALELVLFSEEIITEIDRHRDDWLAAIDDPTRRSFVSKSLDDHQRQRLISIQSAANSAGRPDMLIFALEELLKTETSPQLRENYEEQIRRAQDRMR